MIRVLEDLFSQLFLEAAHYELDFGYTPDHAVSFASRALPNGGRRYPPEIVEAAQKVIYRPNFQIQKGVLKDAAKVIQAIGQDGQDATLVDTMVEILQSSFARNCLSGSGLRALREALLIPDEVAGLRDKLAAESACAGCGHQFVAGEMATINREAGQTSVRCTRCARPSFVAQSGADGHVAVQSIKGLASSLKKNFVNEEPQAAQAAQGQAPWDPVQVVEAAFGREVAFARPAPRPRGAAQTPRVVVDVNEANGGG